MILNLLARSVGAIGGVEEAILTLLALFATAAVVSVAVEQLVPVPYTIGLVLAGLLVSLLDLPLSVTLTEEFILLVVLPTLVFQSSINIDGARFREELRPILTLAVPGLVLSVVVVGAAAPALFGFSPAVALLLGAILLPTDPVSVVALFDELGAPEQLSVLVEGESLLNDGVGIVLYTVLLGLVVEARGVPTAELVTASDLVRDVVVGIVGAMVGGVVVGGLVGYAAYRLLALTDDATTGILVTFLVAYGAYVVAEQIAASGVVATLAAGLLLSRRSTPEAVGVRARLRIGEVWETAAFLANTVIFVAIGLATPVALLVENAGAILTAVVLVFLARAVVVYPLTGLHNWRSVDTVPWSYQHVVVWAGIHTSVPIALALGLPERLPAPLRERLLALVFGVATVTLLVQGLTMASLVERLGIVTKSDDERLYELLVGRLHGVDAAIEAAEEYHEHDDMPTPLYEDAVADYETERDRLDRRISQLIETSPELREKEQLLDERRLLQREELGIRNAMERGVVSREAGEKLLEEVQRRSDRVAHGQPTLGEDDLNRAAVWQSVADAHGLQPGGEAAANEGAADDGADGKSSDDSEDD
ncbi:cation:proton antiporter [Halomicrococcus gelatinilyticus]|uniref:cation:proton antiporter n=1 Tax=Halomicrococcus gelatinilyticus TaxID=1702103 RepID=UPI002E158ACA